MKRRACKVLLFLLALLVGGAIINIAVAWGFAAFEAFHEPIGQARDIDESNMWIVSVEPGRVSSALSSSFVGHTGWSNTPLIIEPPPIFPEWCRLSEAQPKEWQDSWEQRVAGWPCFALWCSFHGLPNWETECRGGIAIPHEYWQVTDVDRGNPRALPLLLLFPGFAINTIFYAAMLWVLFAVPGAVRRRVRIKRGQCAACGYSLRENSSEKCPECGAVVLTRSTA